MFDNLEAALTEMQRLGARKLSDLPEDDEKIELSWDYVESIMNVVIEAKALVAQSKTL